MDCASTERVLEPQLSQRAGLRVATGISILLHGLLVGVLVWFGDRSNREPVSPAIDELSISLVNIRSAESVAPGPLVAEAESEVEIAQEAVLVDPDTLSQDQSTEPSADAETPAEVVAGEAVSESMIQLPDVPEIAESERVAETPAVPPLLPSPLTMQQTVRDFALARSRDRTLRVCTPLQTQNEILDCPEQEILSTQTELPKRLNLSFTVSAEPDRYREAMGTIAANRQQLQANLDDTGLDSATADYLREQLSQGIEVYSGSGNAPLERLQDQIYRNDEAYQQAQRVLNPR